MRVAIIILSIGLIGSVFFNILLSSSKNSYLSQIKKIQKYNNKLESDNEEVRNLVRQQENKIKTYEQRLRTVEHKKKESDRPQIEQLKKENKRLTMRVAELEETVLVQGESDEKVKQFKAATVIEEQKKNANQRREDVVKKQNVDYQTQLINMQKQNAVLSANINSLLNSKTELEKKNSQLLEQLNQLSQIKRKNEELQSNCSNYKIQIVQKEERISELEKEIKELTDSSRNPDIPSTPNVPNKLDVPIDSDVIQFKDGEFNDTLKRISDVSAMTEYLKKSSHEKAQRYLKRVKAYAEEIEELEDAIACLDEDEDEISSECISKFSKVFNEYMADSVIEPVFKAKDEEKFYSEFLKLIIEYVSKCGIYTRNVATGSKYENINYMEVIIEDTTDSAKHKIISRILRLPFYAKYTSETGKVREKLLSKGSCVVLKAK